MKKASLILFLTCLPALLAARQLGGTVFMQRADSLLNTILALYQVPEHGLLMETYPRNPKQQITYTINEGANLTQQEVSFLWPYSSIVSGCVSMYKVSKAERMLCDNTQTVLIVKKPA